MTAIASSLQYQASSVTSLLLTTSPILVVSMAHVLLEGERMTWRKLLGSLIAFAGAGLLIIRGETGLGEFVQADWRGYAWVGLAVLSSTCGLVYAQRFLSSADSFDVASIRMFTSALIMVPVVLLSTGYDFYNLDIYGSIYVLYTSLVGAFFAFILSFYIVKQFGAMLFSLTFYVTPIVTTILGVLFLEERATLVIIISMALIFVGITLLNYRPKLSAESYLQH